MIYKVLDLFSGAGGLSLGFCGGSDRDFSPVLALDNDEWAVATYEANFGCHAIEADVEQWCTRGDVPAADVVVGGPPCQGFSLLNKKRKGDERRALWSPFLDAVKYSGARIFVMENVAELSRSPEIQSIEERAKELGFRLVYDVLNAADYGAPQTRRRTVIIGWDPKLVPHGVRLPKPTHARPDALKDGQQRWVTVRDAIGDLPAKPIGTEIGEDVVLGLHFGRNPTKISQERYRHVPEGGNRFDLQENAPHLTPPCWIRKKSGGTDLFGRLWWERPSVTIRTEFFKPEKGRYLHPEEHRPITHREAARLMGFPDGFQFKGNKTQIARQIGNAVPPALARAISFEVRCALNKASPNQTETRNLRPLELAP